ncbi:MAG: hypothetical protein OEZ58_02255 [Gammaproteobacteria bacterium]|nr:hypothetical protein [Gammaproteobacteria bacterium]MDH5727785.1 hypothetical protein [Gammaproteobacteria bacterium]
MAWTFDDTGAKTNVIPAAAGAKYYAFRRLIRDNGHHPKTAAEQLGDSNYEDLGGNKYSIRLSQEHRVYFTLDQTALTVTVSEVGKHKRS